MRTTVTLDPDLASRLREVARQRQISFKAAINAAIRAGLTTEIERKRSYREKSRDLGVQPGVDLTKALKLAATLEDEATIHKLRALPRSALGEPARLARHAGPAGEVGDRSVGGRQFGGR